MSHASSRALNIARPVIRGLIILNVIYAVGIALLLLTSFLIADWPFRPLGFDRVNAHPQIGPGLRALAVVGLISTAIVYTILRRLLAIVDTVRDGDPFTFENTQRLNVIAWCVAALEGLRMIIAAIAAVVWQAAKIDAFSLASWLAVLLLFVLAGVFAQGARMRADLEGTV